jgi:NADH:ubiquinone oxidoreductase subunit 3 (subunit A)
MNKPLWVKVGMIGIKSRSVAMRWLYAEMLLIIFAPIVIFTVLTSFKNAPLFPAITRSLSGTMIIVLTVLWYWFCIKWMDDNKGWTP